MTAMRLKRYPSPSGGFALGKMGVGATMLKQGKTARDYVQSGLIAMWDGIENAGWGTHDPNATTWKDLAGNNDFEHTRPIDRWADDAAIFTGATNDGAEDWNIDRIQTLEVAGKALSASYFAFCLYASGQYPRRMFGILPTNNRGFQFATSAPSMFADWMSARWSVAATWSNASDYNQSAQYYNGQYHPSNSGTSTWNVLTQNRAQLGRMTGQGYLFYGEICCIRAYSRALTAAEIAANYAIDKERFNLP